MSVLLETSLGELVIDLEVDRCPRICENFLKLCKVKYYGLNAFFNVSKDFICQTGDPTATGTGGESFQSLVWSQTHEGPKPPRYIEPEITTKLKHKEKGTVSMAVAPVDPPGCGSQFFITLADNIDYLDGKHSVFGHVIEGLDTLDKINEAFLDPEGRPLQDIRIRHVEILEDPFDDPPDMIPIPDSPLRAPDSGFARIADDENPFKEMSEEQAEEERRKTAANSSALTLEMIGDLPFAAVRPPENILFVCKLNPVTQDDDLELIFSRFGKILSCEIVRDKKSGDSLQYAFIEFDLKESAEQAYFKMQNVLVDDRRIHVDFSQTDVVEAGEEEEVAVVDTGMASMHRGNEILVTETDIEGSAAGVLGAMTGETAIVITEMAPEETTGVTMTEEIATMIVVDAIGTATMTDIAVTEITILSEETGTTAEIETAEMRGIVTMTGKGEIGIGGTTVPRYIRIKKPDGAEPIKPTPPPKAPEQPTPAEKPVDVPPTIDAGKKFEPEVNSQGTAEATSAPGATEEPLKTAVPPSEPPKPEEVAPKAEEVVDEIPDKPDLSKLPSLNIDPEAQVRAQEAIEQPKEDAKKQKAGGKRQPKYESSIDRKRKMMARLGYVTLAVGIVAASWYVGESKGEEKGEEKEKKSFFEQAKANFGAFGDIFSKPAFEVLLPDPLPAPHQRPYTLLVDLEDMLVHSSWDRQHGWRTAKRPGVDYFLGYLSQFYEIVLFSSQPSLTGAPVAEKLDPMTLYLPYKLFREATRYVDGKVVKDIDYLNRDPRKVVMLEVNPEHAHLQPDNAIIMPRWNGKAGDKGLIEMIPFLESIAIFAPQDVRPVLKHYAGKDIPREYAKKEAEQKAAAIAEWERTHPVKGGSSWTTSLFGGSGQSRPQQPMTYLEIKRQQAQRAYEEEQKYYNEHKEEFMRLIEEDKQRQIAAMKGPLFGFMGGDKEAQEPAAQQAAQAQSQQQQK